RRRARYARGRRARKSGSRRRNCARGPRLRPARFAAPGRRLRRPRRADRLARLRKDAYLVNVARGPLIDAAALAHALGRNQFAGAALDTFDEEPLPASSPLWTLPNVFITPHTAAVTEKLWERHYALIAENMRRFLAGRPLLNLVDKSRGY